MLKREVRELNEEERATLRARTPYHSEGPLQGLMRWLRYFLGGAITGLLVTQILAGLLWRFRLPVPGWLGPVGIAAGLVVGAAALRWETEWLRRRRREYLLDLADNRIEVLRGDVLDAVQLGETEEDGPGFFLDLGEGQLLFADGECYGEDGEELLPNRRVEIRRTPRRCLDSGIMCLGERFEPSRVRAWFGEDEYFPEDGEIISGTLPTLDEDLRRLAREREGE